MHRLIGSLLYGTGLRIMEAMRLRIKDVDFSRREIIVRDGKGNKDRVTMLPVRSVVPLRDQITHARELHRGDLASGLGAVCLPHALDRKYPGAAREWACYDIRTVQELLGHSDVSTTMIYTHVLNRGGRGVVSPLDRA